MSLKHHRIDETNKRTKICNTSQQSRPFVQELNHWQKKNTTKTCILVISRRRKILGRFFLKKRTAPFSSCHLELRCMWRTHVASWIWIWIGLLVGGHWIYTMHVWPSFAVALTYQFMFITHHEFMPLLFATNDWESIFQIIARVDSSVWNSCQLFLALFGAGANSRIHALPA